MGDEDVNAFSQKHVVHPLGTKDYLVERRARLLQPGARTSSRRWRGGTRHGSVNARGSPKWYKAD